MKYAAHKGRVRLIKSWKNNAGRVCFYIVRWTGPDYWKYVSMTCSEL